MKNTKTSGRVQSESKTSPRRREIDDRSRHDFNNVRPPDEVIDAPDEPYEESERIQREIRHSTHRF